MNGTVLLIIAVLILGIALLALIGKARKKKGLDSSDHELIRQKWVEIMQTAEVESKHAIIEAHKLLDHVLKKKGFEGTVAEKLKKAQEMIKNPEALWSVHKMRNKIAHEIDYTLQKDHAKKSLEHFKNALKDLGAKL